MIPKKRTPLTTKKASLRTHIEQNKAALAGRKTKPVLRVYQNEAGETFTVERTYYGQNTPGRGEKSFKINISKQGSGLFARSTIQITKQSIVSNVEGREIYIFDVAIPKFQADPNAKKGRGVFGMVVDECHELGKKEFGKKPYYITLKANNLKTAKHYYNFGFEFVNFTGTKPLTMRLKVN